MKIIADTNIFLAVALNENSKARIINLTKGCDVYAPEILLYEVGNALSAMVKRRQIGVTNAHNAYSAVRRIPVSLMKIDISLALSIAIQQKIDVYEACFLQLALSTSRPFITLDNRLKTVALGMNIELME